jgi:hypothetical protein
MLVDAPLRCQQVAAGADTGELSQAEKVVRLHCNRPVSSKRSVTSSSVASIRLPWHGGSRRSPQPSGEAASNPQLRRGWRKVGVSETHEIMI